MHVLDAPIALGPLVSLEDDLARARAERPIVKELDHAPWRDVCRPTQDEHMLNTTRFKELYHRLLWLRWPELRACAVLSHPGHHNDQLGRPEQLFLIGDDAEFTSWLAGLEAVRIVRVIINGKLSTLRVAAQLAAEGLRGLPILQVVERDSVVCVVRNHTLGRGERECLIRLVEHHVHVKRRQQRRRRVAHNDGVDVCKRLRPFCGVDQQCAHVGIRLRDPKLF